MLRVRWHKKVLLFCDADVNKIQLGKGLGFDPLVWIIQVWSIAFVLSNYLKLLEEKGEIRRWCLVPCWIFGFVRSQVATVSPVPYWITTASQPPVTDSGTAGSSENHRLQCSLQTAQPQSTLSQLLTMMFCTSIVAHDQRELLVICICLCICISLYPFLHSAMRDRWDFADAPSGRH